VTVTNACLCRPPDGKAPPKSAIAACRPRLLNELAGEDKPGTIVAMGNSAALGILGVEGITSLRVGPGKRSPYSELKGKRIIPTIHPAACLRQSDNFPFLVTDIGKIEGASVDAYQPPHWKLLDDPVDAVAALRELEARKGNLVVDIEVDIDKDTSFDHPNHYSLLCVGIGYESGKVIVIGESACASEDVRDALGACLRASRITCQQLKFDLAGLYPVVGPLRGHFDTMLASYCFDERPGVHSLDYNGVEYLGAPDWKGAITQYLKGPTEPELEHYHGYGRIPRPILYKYNAYDVDVTWKLQEVQEKRLDNSNTPPSWYNARWPYKSLRELHDFLVDSANELMYLELNGIKIDREYNKELNVSYLKYLTELKDEIKIILEKAGYPNWKTFNPNSPQQVKALLLFFRINVPDTTKETIQLVKEKLLAIDWDEGEDYALNYVDLHQKFKKEAKLYGTYVKGITARLYGGRVYPTFSLHGTTTGRLASKNPNVQNIPRQSSIKAQFIPGREGNVFVQADYKQAELRILTWMAQEEYFRGILNDPNRDLFDELTPPLYPKAPAPPQYGFSSDDEFAVWKELRIRVKAFVYGLGYGRTHYTIASEFKMTEKEALAVKTRFFELIPSIVEFQLQTKRQVKAGHDLITPFGRHRRFHLITQENWKSVQNEALAFLPQSTSSDVCLRAMARIRRELSGTGAYVRNIVHDSILVDCPSDMANDVASLLDHHMVESARELVGDYVQFSTDVKIGKNWGEV
jgi:DNA polymerase I-like protein with 3'-5' exonuclease and polymerase domains